MPLTSLQLTGLAAAGAAVVATAAFALVDPTASDLDRVAQAAATAGRLSHRLKTGAGRSADVGALIQQPVFIMSTGPAAYHEKALTVSGVAIARGRRAALVSIGGSALRWLQVGESAGDLTLTAVSIDGATFDPPVGQRFVGLSPASVAASQPEAGQAPGGAAQPVLPAQAPRAGMASPPPSNGIDF